MTLFEQRLAAALKALEEGPLGFMGRRPGAGIPGAKPATMPSGKPTTAAPGKPDLAKFTRPPYNVDAHLLQQLAADPTDQDAFDAIASIKGRHVAIEVRNALTGKSAPPPTHQTYETGGYGKWDA